MPTRIFSCLAAAALLWGCSSKSDKPAASKGRIVVALTIDWEGAYLSVDGLDKIDEIRKQLPDAPVTHFISAGYFTKDQPDPALGKTLGEMVKPGDEVAVHLHGWKSLAKASNVEPKLAPSFLTGTDKLLEFEDGDVGFDIDLDAYSVPELRALLRTSKQRLEATKLPVSKSFRAGGYLGTPKVLQAAAEEGFTIDSSATDHRQLDERKDEVLPKRLQAIWPGVDAASQPWKLQGGKLLEVPIAAFADYATADEIVKLFEAAHGKLAKDPTRDVYVVLGFHQETAGEFGDRIAQAMTTVRARKDIADALVFTTIEGTAAKALPLAPEK